MIWTLRQLPKIRVDRDRGIERLHYVHTCLKKEFSAILLRTHMNSTNIRQIGAIALVNRSIESARLTINKQIRDKS